jgi:hypothetical protein
MPGSVGCFCFALLGELAGVAEALGNGISRVDDRWLSAWEFNRLWTDLWAG